MPHGSRRLENLGVLLLKMLAIWVTLYIVGAMHIPLVSGAARIAASIVAFVLEVIVAFLIILIILYVLGIEIPPFASPKKQSGPPRPGRGPGKSGWAARTREWKRIIREHEEIIREIAEEIRAEAEKATEAIRTAIEESREASIGGGRAYHKRRNHENRFPGEKSYETRTLSPDAAEEAEEHVTRHDYMGRTHRSPFPQALLARFKPLEPLGEGGFSTVWKVESTNPPGVYALKLPKLLGEPASRRIFAREAVHWSDLGVHPNIVRLYEWDTDPIPWLLVEYIPGVMVGDTRARSMREFLYIRGRLPECLAIKLALDAARGLEHAHKRGIAHLDLKPGNILLAPEDGGWGVRGKLTDWGMSRVASGTLSVSGVSPGYMAPEHSPYSPYKERGVGWWTDIYQLGLVLYEALTGRNYNRVLLESTPEEALSQIVDERVRGLLSEMLDPDPARRPGAGEVASRLEQLLSQLACNRPL